EFQEAIADLYHRIGIATLAVSAVHDDLQALRQALTGKTTLLAGHSGVGKSTLLNALSPEINQKVGDLSDFSLKGKHTTTFAEMFPLDNNTFVIDTPGIKEWAPADMSDQELSDYFPEMRIRRQDCKF